MTALDRSLRTLTWAALLLITPLVLYYATEGTGRLTHQNVEGGWSGAYYWANAEGLLVHGRLDVDPIHILGECFERQGRCYGYFGLTPTLLRVPVLGILRFFHSALTPVFLATALLIAYGTTLLLVRRGLHVAGAATAPATLVLAYFGVVALALGPASTLVFLSRPAVFEEAMAWAVAFVLLAWYHAWRWLDGETARLWPAVVCAVAAANARPTAAIAVGLLGLLVCTHCLRQGTTTRTRVLALSLALLPGLTAAGVFWVKLGTPLPSVRMSRQVQEAPHWRDILARNGNRTGGVVFAPTALLTYLRPDTVTCQARWPYCDFRIRQESITWIPPLAPGGAYVERTASLTTTMPLPWLINGIAIAWLLAQARLGRRRSPAFASLAGLFLSAIGMCVLTVTTVGITTRYLGDFYPMSVAGATIAPLAMLAPLGRSWQRRRWLAAGIGLVAVVLVIWGVIVTLSLNAHLVFD